jgi:hypothetical protein
MRRPLFTLACVAIIYAIPAFVVLPQEAFVSSDEGLKFIQLQNFVRRGISGLTLDYPGRGLDPDLNYIPINNPPVLIRGGQIYAVYPVFFPLLVAPLYRALSYAGLYVIPLASGLLTLLAAYYLARLTGGRGISSIIVLGLCSPLLFYSLVFWDHTLGTILSTLAMVLVVRELEDPRKPWLLGAGILVGLAIWVRSEIYVLVPVMAAVFLLTTRRLAHTLALCLGMLMALVPLWLFQFFVYGSFIGPHVGHLAWLADEVPVTTDRVAIFYHTLLEGNSSPVLSFLYIMAFVSSAILVRSSKLRRNKLLVTLNFGILIVATIPNILEAANGKPLGGLITTGPFLVFACTTLLSTSQLEKRNYYLLAISMACTALVCLATPVDPGLQWGPRFLLPIFPPLAVVATNNFHALHVRGDRGASLLKTCFIAVVALSFLVQLSGLRTLYIIKARDRQLIQHVDQLGVVHILTDEYGYAQYAAPLFYEKQFFYVRSQEDYQRLVETLVSHSINRYAFVTYPIPSRRAVDPLNGPECCVVQAVGPQLFEIAQVESSP